MSLITYEWDYEKMIDLLENHFKYYTKLDNDLKNYLIKEVVMNRAMFHRDKNNETINHCKMCGKCCRKQRCFNLDENNKCIEHGTSNYSFLCSEYPYMEREDGEGFDVYVDTDCYFSRKVLIDRCEAIFRISIEAKEKVVNPTISNLTYTFEELQRELRDMMSDNIAEMLRNVSFENLENVEFIGDDDEES